MPLKTYRLTISLKEPFQYGVFVGTMTTTSPVENMPGYEHIMAIYETETQSEMAHNNILVNSESTENVLMFENLPEPIIENGIIQSAPHFTKQGITISRFQQISGKWMLRNEGGSYKISNDNGGIDTGIPVIVKITFMTDQFCFNVGTKIRCLTSRGTEEDIPIDKLSRGDLVKTYLHGYRPIVKIGKGVMFNNHRDIWNCMYEYPHSDYLTLTGGHAILCDTISAGERERLTELYRGGKIAMLDNKYVVFANMSDLFRQVQGNGRNDEIYVYYHLALDGDGETNRRFGIWANGVMAETSTIVHLTNQNYVSV
jgi:hypothetical protein